jgi:fatty acid desaturase
MNTEPDPTGRATRSGTRVALAVLLAAALLLLVLEHRAHLLGAIPLLLILLVCVGSHFLMHRGHGAAHRSTHGRPGGESGDGK